MLLATKSGDWEQINKILKDHPNLAHEDLSTYNFTALHSLSCTLDKDSTIRSIRNLINLYNVDINALTKYGDTPLQNACSSGNINIARELLCYGAKIPKNIIFKFNFQKYTHARCSKMLQTLNNRTDYIVLPSKIKNDIMVLLANPPQTYKEKEKNKLLVILNKLPMSLGTCNDIDQILISIGY
jgi:ankyrin repeat protein